MRRKSAAATSRRASPTPENDCIQAVDAALGLVSRYGWVPHGVVAALLETIDSSAGTSGQPEVVRELVDQARDDFEDDRLASADVTDRLLDLRNAAQRPRVQLAARANA